MNFNERSLIVTDLETTGLDGRIHDIIEIGALRLHQQTLEELDRFELKIKIEHPETVSPQALLVNGYRDDLWTNAVDRDTAMTRFAVFAKDGILVAYNITFEHSFLQENFRRTGIDMDKVMDYHRIDVPSIVWFQNPTREKINLNVVCKEYGIEQEPTVHRAINGAEILVKILRGLRNV